MAEVTLDLRVVPKPQAYRDLDAHLDAVLDGITDEIAMMATMAALIHHGFGHLWTGFYRVVEPGRLLRVGPYQGTLGCLEIAFGHGVCGTAAAEERTVVVPDVSRFPGHIVCDPKARSEIVVPVFGPERSDASHGPGARERRLIAVLDIDSTVLDAFDAEDRQGLERLVRRFARAR
jgi:L-methionine (R)-S-oxide reductase